MSMPVVTALLCIRPRVWRGRRAYGTAGLEDEIRQGMTDIVQVRSIDYVPCGLLQQS
jgi:hypothetical protein